jgi:ABC-type Zn2+ transport system substrate-binding protein/surface adhesin
MKYFTLKTKISEYRLKSDDSWQAFRQAKVQLSDTRSTSLNVSETTKIHPKNNQLTTFNVKGRKSIHHRNPKEQSELQKQLVILRNSLKMLKKVIKTTTGSWEKKMFFIFRDWSSFKKKFSLLM